MAKALLAVLFCALVAAVSAHQHGGMTCNATVGPANPFRRTPCSGYAACEVTLCQCMGDSAASASTAATCLMNARAATTCDETATCFGAFARCLTNLASATRANESHPCAMWGVTMHTAMLTASTTGLEGSMLARGCANKMCDLANKTSKTSCSFGGNFSGVCSAANLLASSTAMPTTTPAASPLPDNFVAAIRATMRIAGTQFAALLNDPARRQELFTAVRTALGRLTGVNPEFVRIIRMYIGSLVVDFAIDAAAGVAPDVLQAALNNAANDNSWLEAVQTVYSQVSNDTLTATVEITETAAPGAVTPVPPTTAASISSASTVSTMLVAVFAVAALLL